jgi:hypothetical protein
MSLPKNSISASTDVHESVKLDAAYVLLVLHCVSFIYFW